MENIERIEIVKEGIYYTLYINGKNLGCGDLEDIIGDMDDYIDSWKEELTQEEIKKELL